MRIGLAVSGRGNNLKVIERLAVRADELGYDCMLVTDHFMLPEENYHPDVWTVLPYLGAKTRKIRLGTCVTPLPFRPPAMLAKMVATCDVLSNGRVILGAGVGWFKPEFDGFSNWLETKDRIVASREAIELMIKLWEQPEPVDFEGEFVRSKGAVIEPKPVQKPHPPIWFGGHMPNALRTTGRYGQGWIPIGPRWFDDNYPRPQQYAEMRKSIIQEMGKRKRKDVTERNFVFSMLINWSENLSLLRSDVEKYMDAGMNYFVLGDKAQSEASLKNIETVARDIGRSY